MGDGTTVKAIDLKVGSMVQTSDGQSKEVLGMRLQKVAGTADLCLEAMFFFALIHLEQVEPKGRVDMRTNTIDIEEKMS